MVFIVYKMSCNILLYYRYPAILNYSLCKITIHESEIYRHWIVNTAGLLPRWHLDSHFLEPDQSSDVILTEVEREVSRAVWSVTQQTHVRVSPHYLGPGLPPGLQTPPAGLGPLPGDQPPQPPESVTEVVCSQVHQCTRCTRCTALQWSYPDHYQPATELGLQRTQTYTRDKSSPAGHKGWLLGIFL